MPPVILAPVGTNIATTGEAVVLPCSVYSDPPPLVTWYKGTTIQEDILIIFEVSVIDFLYTLG